MCMLMLEVELLHVCTSVVYVTYVPALCVLRLIYTVCVCVCVCACGIHWTIYVDLVLK